MFKVYRCYSQTARKRLIGSFVTIEEAKHFCLMQMLRNTSQGTLLLKEEEIP